MTGCIYIYIYIKRSAPTSKKTPLLYHKGQLVTETSDKTIYFKNQYINLFFGSPLLEYIARPEMLTAGLIKVKFFWS